MAESRLLFRSLSDIADQIRRQEVSPLEVTRAVLDRLAHLNPRLNAVLTNLGEQALEAAQRAEDDIAIGQPRGPLHGVPLALKDIFALRGVQVTAGSKVLGTWIADYDATVVVRSKPLTCGCRFQIISGLLIPADHRLSAVSANIWCTIRSAFQKARALPRVLPKSSTLTSTQAVTEAIRSSNR